jgi:hypothetical protein
MDIAIHNSKKKVSVSDDAFAASFNETLVHQLVVSSPGARKVPVARVQVPFAARSGAPVE